MIKINNYCHTFVSVRISALSAFILFFTVNLICASNTLAGNLHKVQISPFKAQYYTENDGKNPGRGNDGTIKDVTAKLQFSESVKRPSINFSYSDYNGIDSYNFYGIWEGTMHVTGQGQSVKAHFDVSRADVSFFVNDKLVEKWRDDSKTVQFNLNNGNNSIRVELHNHWHTTSFNVSFTDYQKPDKATALELFKNIDFNSTKAVYLGAYAASSRNPGNNYNEILITLPQSSQPVFLFLNSYRAVNWVVSNYYNTKIVGVVLRAHAPGSTVALSSPAPVYELPVGRDSYKSSYDVRTLIGKNADYAFTEYGFSNIIIPDFFLTKTAHSQPENGSISTSNSSNPAQPEHYPVNSFRESLVVQQQNTTVTNTKVVKEPALNGTFIKGSWKGYFDVTERLDKSFKLSHRGIRAELTIDGRSVWRGTNSGEKLYQHTFNPGKHEIMFVAYPEVESKPGTFNVSITDNAKDLKYEELKARLKELGNFDSIYCGVEKSTPPKQSVDIILEDSEIPVVLFLTSYKQVAWNFENSNTENLAAIVTSAKNAAEAIKNLPPHIPVFHFFRLANTTQFIPTRGQSSIRNTFKRAALQILALTGNLPVGFSGAKQTATIAAPEMILDRGKYLDIGFPRISPDYNIFIEYPQKIDVVFNPVPTKYIDPNSSSGSTRAKSIKPEVQRKSWAEPLGATQNIPTDAFKAYYFDIYNPGQPKFRGIVEDVSVQSSGKTHLNSAGSVEHDIIPTHFGAFWIGKIVLKEDKEMEINLDSSHSATRILLDDQEVNTRKIFLKKGVHKIEIEHVNDWHSYGFSFSLTEPQPLLAYEELKEQLTDILPRRVHTAYVGVYNSENVDNSITLDIDDVGKPIFLILTSYHAVNWVLQGPGAKDVKALLVSSMRSKSKIKGAIDQDVARFHFPMWNYTYQLESKCECQGRYYCSSKDLFDTIDYIDTITDRSINSFAGSYSARSFNVLETIIDRKQLKELKNRAKENLLAQAKCEGPQLSPQYLNSKQRKQIDEHISVQTALHVMEVIRDNRFEDSIEFIEPGKIAADPNGMKQLFLFQHNRFAGYDASLAYHLIDHKMAGRIAANKGKLTIPMVLKRSNRKDYYIKVHMTKAGNSWFVSHIE